MPFLAMMLVFRYNRLLTFNIPSDAQMLIVALIFAYTIFLPLMAVLFLKRIKLVQSFEMHSRDERKWAYLLSALCYYICYYILSGYSGLVIISTLMLGATIACLCFWNGLPTSDNGIILAGRCYWLGTTLPGCTQGS
jgi:hypothetical protein